MGHASHPRCAWWLTPFQEQSLKRGLCRPGQRLWELGQSPLGDADPLVGPAVTVASSSSLQVLFLCRSQHSETLRSGVLYVII